MPSANVLVRCNSCNETFNVNLGGEDLELGYVYGKCIKCHKDGCKFSIV